jgi:hypothetical protein
MKDFPEPVRLALAEALPHVVEEVVVAVAREVPGYRRPLRGRFGRGVRRGVELALARYLDTPLTGDSALAADELAVYSDLGRGELRQGRSLDALLTAYRVGARVAFRRFAEVALAAGVEGEDLVTLAEATFAYIDRLSAASTEGYAAEQSRRAGQLDRLRHDLVEALLSGQADPVAVDALASRLRVRVPADVVLVVAAAEDAETLAHRLGASALVATRGEHVVALLPPSRRLPQRLGDVPSAYSSPQPVAGLPLALRLALLTLRLPRVEGPVSIDERLGDLLLAGDPVLTAALAARRLGPLDGAKPQTRARLEATLLSWLSHQGSRNAVAEDLHLHPQTIAYRLGLLRDLFGSELDDPRVRFELELALRGRALAG